MGKQTEKQKTTSALRKKAEARLRKLTGKTIHELSTDDSHSFIHELQVHQIELEMQNEELRASQELLENSRSRYSDLYDFAPIGYFTCNKHGLILEANMTGAEQLGLERRSLIKKPLSRFVHKDDADIYYLHCHEVMKSEKRKTCDIRMKRSDKSEFYAQLVSTAIKDETGSTLIRSAVMNITERRTAEIKLIDSETSYRNLVDNSLVGIFKTHISGKFIYVNDAFANIYEYDSPASVLSEETLSFYKYPEERADIIKKLRRIGKISNYEIEAITKNGQTKNVLFNATLEGKIISGMVMDISERKNAEREMLRLTERLEAQWKLAGMVETGSKQLCDLVLAEIISMSDSRYGFYGFVDEDAHVMTVHAWSEEVMKDCMVHDNTLIFPIEKSGVWGNAIRNKKTLIINDYSGEEHANKKGFPDGHVSINRIMVIPVFRRNRIVALGAVANRAVDYSEQDSEQMNAFLQSAQLIQDKRIAEEKIADLSKFPSENPNPVMRIDRDVNILYKNEAMSNLLKKRKISGKDILKILPRNLKKRIIDSLNTEKPVYDLEVHTGNRIYSYSIAPVVKNNYVNLYAIDITERKKAEEELEKHRNHLTAMIEERTRELKETYTELNKEVREKLNYQEEAFRSAELASIGELAAGVAHEINNPINGIINLAQMLAVKNDPGSKDHELARLIMKEGDRIANIVSSLLSFAREKKEEKKSVAIYEIMGDTLALTESQLKKDGIKLQVNIPTDLPFIYAQYQQLEQVFLNIISNARHAINEKYPDTGADKVLHITVEKTAANGKSFLRLIFLDNGTGIPYNTLNNIMKPFFTTKHNTQGTGLGLSISYGIIVDHGGTIKIDSIYGEFTKVTIDLPVRK